ncbi:MAG TPA: glycosyltransferase, partial [Bacteroidia bacterium]|nr:glycosyltransferase [Bacteroidia bacterium]
MNKLVNITACVIIPTYNNAQTLKKVIDGVLIFSSGNDVIVINDGSTVDTTEILKQYDEQIILLTNKTNKGKGYSLRKGFEEAIRRGFKNAITIDSD